MEWIIIGVFVGLATFGNDFKLDVRKGAEVELKEGIEARLTNEGDAPIIEFKIEFD